MKNVVFVGLLMAVALATSPITRAATPAPRLQPQVVTTFVDGDLVIATSGEVESYRVTTKIDPGIAARVEELVRKLRFEPITIEGHAVRANTHMRVTLVGSPQADGGMRVGIDNITFPDEPSDAREATGVRMEVTRKLRPGYPVSALQSGIGADVLVAVHVGLDGRIQEAIVRQSALLDVRGSDRVLTALLKEFEQTSLQAIKAWRIKVDVSPGAAPTPEQLSGVIAMSFRVNGAGARAAGRWTWETRSEKRVEPWLAPVPGVSTAGISDLGVEAGLIGTGSTRYRLATPLATGAL